jgi:hypothetical protein
MDGGVLAHIGHPAVVSLNAVSAGLDEAAYADVWSLSDDDLADALVRCEQLAARQAALSLRLIREADARDLGRRQGASSTTAWLKDRLRLRPGEAKARVDLAHRLEGGGHRSMPATATALAAGAVSGGACSGDRQDHDGPAWRPVERAGTRGRDRAGRPGAHL